MATISIAARIIGRGWPAAAVDPDRSLRLGFQYGRDVRDVRACDAPEIRFDFLLDLALDTAGAAVDWRGTMVHGPPGARFLYLCRGRVGDGGAFAMNSRAKLSLPALAGDAIGRLGAGDAILIVTLDRADQQGRPVSGGVRSPRVAWSLG